MLIDLNSQAQPNPVAVLVSSKLRFRGGFHETYVKKQASTPYGSCHQTPVPVIVDHQCTAQLRGPRRLSPVMGIECYTVDSPKSYPPKTHILSHPIAFGSTKSKIPPELLPHNPFGSRHTHKLLKPMGWMVVILPFLYFDFTHGKEVGNLHHT